MESRHRITNDQIASLIGTSFVSVSRFRTGTRTPGTDLMVRIESALAWPVADQITARQQGTYAAEFQARIDALAELL